VREIPDAARSLTVERGRYERNFPSLNKSFFLVLMKVIQKAAPDRLTREVGEDPNSLETDFGETSPADEVGVLTSEDGQRYLAALVTRGSARNESCRHRNRTFGAIFRTD
jgi:hypothetical protein